MGLHMEVVAPTFPRMSPADKKSLDRFTPYQTFVIASLSFLQFAVILDFMIVAPLGALVMPALEMSPRDFGVIVSAYAFSAGARGLLSPGLPTASTARDCCCSSTSASCWAPSGAARAELVPCASARRGLSPACSAA